MNDCGSITYSVTYANGVSFPVVDPYDSSISIVTFNTGSRTFQVDSSNTLLNNTQFDIVISAFAKGVT